MKYNTLAAVLAEVESWGLPEATLDTIRASKDVELLLSPARAHVVHNNQCLGIRNLISKTTVLPEAITNDQYIYLAFLMATTEVQR